MLDASTQGYASSTQVTAWFCVRESINEREKRQRMFRHMTECRGRQDQASLSPRNEGLAWTSAALMRLPLSKTLCTSSEDAR